MKYIKNSYTASALLFFLICTNNISSRSIQRPRDPHLPEIQANWVGSKDKHILRESHLEEYPLFKLFDRKHFFSHQLPSKKILFRNNPTKKVNGSILVKQIQELITEVHAGKRKFKHFIVLQEKNFNRNLASGLLIVKFKEYPFVVKLFIETPSSFVKPFDKGWEPRFLFFMSGGVNRHMTGFTRIKNLQLVNKHLKKSKKWSSLVDTPRKWFWFPRSTAWIDLHGKNIGNKYRQHIRFPGTYCIIADAIESKHEFSILNADERKFALDLCNYLEMLIDAHINNFMVEKNTGRIVIVDTEHFPTVVGFRNKPPKFDSYTSWYLYLVRKCGRETFFRTKKERRRAQSAPNEMQLF